MAEASEQELEAASAVTEQLRDSAVAGIRASLQGEGCAECEECEDPISQARRDALPSARRCAACQLDFENRKKRG